MIWIDVNQLVHWYGPLSGIQRTQFEFARAASFHKDVRFFYQTSSGQSQEYFFDSQKLENGFASKPNKKKVLLRASVFPRFLRKIRRLLSSSKANIGTRQFQFENQQNTLFHRGDTVLFIGASWIQENAVAEAVSLHGVRVGVLLYDMIPILHPEFFGHGYGEHFTKFTFEGLSGVDFFMSISETTTLDFMNLCQDREIPLRPIIRLKLGSAVREKVGMPPAHFSAEDQFVLSVGTIEIRKNYELLYQAWLLAEKQEIYLPTLVIAGKQGWLAEATFKNLSQAQHKFAKIQVLESVSDSELNWLYQHALFTLYPSLYEGWGLPITESLALGKLCIAANTAASREAGEGLILLINPSDPKELLDKVQSLCMHPQQLAAYEHKISASFVPTLWEDSVAEVLAEIRSL